MRKATIFVLGTLMILALSNTAISFEKASEIECVEMCKKAAQMILEKGLDASIEIINDKNGPFVWKDTYIFLIETDTTTLLAHPLDPSLIGKNHIGRKDANGKLFVVEFTHHANSRDGQGWVDYLWPKPGENTPSRKKTFIYRVPGTTLAVGAGIYY